jgi:hypothetical protein
MIGSPGPRRPQNPENSKSIATLAVDRNVTVTQNSGDFSVLIRPDI